jgi:serine/threonine-protein kinase
MRLGAYEVLALVGEGAQATVARARSPSGEEVAIKVLRSAATDSLERFQREARIMRELGLSLGFVPILDVGSAPEGPFLVMPYLGGGTLRERMARGPLSPTETLALGANVARSLAHAHARRIVHRDLKPENIIFDAAGRPYIADLGIAKHFAHESAESASLSKTGEFRGTPRYMPLEQFDASKSVGPGSDVFALGAILYECLAGRPPFDGATLLERLQKMDAPPRPLERSDVPPRLRTAIERALARSPADRFEDAGAFARALEPEQLRRRRIPLVTAALVLVTALALVAWRTARAAEIRSTLAEGWRLVTPEASQDDLRHAVASFTRALALDPSLPRAFAGRALARVSLEELDPAFEDATRAIELDPSFGQAWDVRGWVHELRGEGTSALADLTRAIELDPTLTVALRHRALVRKRLRDHAAALRDASQAVALEPRMAVNWCTRCMVRLDSGDAQGAASDATRAIEIDPTSVAAWTDRGLARKALGDRTSALADLDRAIGIAPHDPVALLCRGAVHAESGDYAEAIRDLSAAIDADPRDARLWSDRAAAHGNRGDVQEAITDATRAIELDAKFPEPFLTRANALYQRGDLDGAAADYQRALALGDERARAGLEAIQSRRRP